MFEGVFDALPAVERTKFELFNSKTGSEKNKCRSRLVRSKYQLLSTGLTVSGTYKEGAKGC